jgi:hypothetical protein
MAAIRLKEHKGDRESSRRRRRRKMALTKSREKKGDITD